jgi:GntR family transcriptional regulator
VAEHAILRSDTSVIEKTGRPAYLQIADGFRAKIRAGELPDGQPLPSTAQLATQHAVSASVIKAAISVLRTEGLVVGQQGKGVFVRAAGAAAVESDRPVGEGSVGRQLGEILETLRDMSDRLSRLEAEVFPTPPRTPPTGS